jgi:hypothetical protein
MFGVHLPMKSEEDILDPGVVLMVFCLMRKRLCVMTCLCFALGTVSA